MYIPLIWFLPYFLVSSCFSPWILFFIFISFLLVWWCPLPIFPSTWKFPFLRAFWFFHDLFFSFKSSSYHRYMMVSHWSLSDYKSPQASRTLLGILADLNNFAVWTVSTHPLISKASSPWIDPLVTVPRAPIIIGIKDTFIFHSFFQFPSKVQLLIILFAFSQLHSVVSRDSKVHKSVSSLFFPLLLGQCDPFVSQNPRGVRYYNYYFAGRIEYTNR